MDKRWYSHKQVIFDCDSTLSRIEGIDVLAERQGMQETVEAMTNAAMDGDIALDQVYGKRLELIQPCREDIDSLKEAYMEAVVADARIVIALLQQSGHQVHIVSGGLYGPVRDFGVALGVPKAQIHAVDVSFNQLSGQWWQNSVGANQQQYLDYVDGPLVRSDGKCDTISSILSQYSGRSLLIGDGISDMNASCEVDLFVGYGGVVRREKVEQGAKVYMTCESLLPLLALAGGESMIAWLCDNEPDIAEQTYALLIKHTQFTDRQVKQQLLALFNRDKNTH